MPATLHPALRGTDDERLGYSALQSAAASASSTMARGVTSGQPLEVTAVQGAGAAATVYAGSTLSASAAAIAIPVIGAAVAGVTFWIMRNRMNNIQKEKATEIVNAAEAKMKENLQAYLSGPRTVSSQRQALANFDALWDFIVRGCTAVGGSAGERCIAERQRGGSAPWCPTGTGCDYFSLYRDPIANDSPGQDSLSGFIDPATGQFSTGSGGWMMLAIAAGAAAVAIMAVRKDQD